MEAHVAEVRSHCSSMAWRWGCGWQWISVVGCMMAWRELELSAGEPPHPRRHLVILPLPGGPPPPPPPPARSARRSPPLPLATHLHTLLASCGLARRKRHARPWSTLCL
jgi:hypothetical protein